MRVSTSWSQANGSILFSSQELTKLRHRFPAAITAQKRPVTAADGYTPQRTFRPVVIYGQVAIFEIPRERQPVLQQVGNRLSGLTLGSCEWIDSR